MSTNPLRSLVTLVLLGALLAGCGGPATEPAATPLPPTPTAIPPTPAPTAEPETEAPSPVAAAPEPVGLRPDAPRYAVHGPYWVGYKPVVIGEGTDHPIDAGMWYPALNPNGDPEEIIYLMPWKIPSMPLDTEPLAYGHALLDAAINESGAPYPLVVFSPGLGTAAPWYSNLIEHYASYGFVVLAPEHIETWDAEVRDKWSTSIDRPLAIKRTLDYAEQATAAGGDMAGLIDMQHVAVEGHSYGGYTALAMAGAQYDLDAFNARCAALPPGDPNMFFCAPLVSREADMAARAGLDAIPEGLWPSFGDPRVTAIIPIAGDAYLFDKVGLSKITIPMMAIGGTADTGTPYDWGSKLSYDNASSAKKVLVTLDGAEHTITTSCENLPWMYDTPFGGWICFDPVWDKDRGMDLINHFSTAFLLDTLKGDAEAAAALAPENVTFPGIRYETTAYTDAAATVLDDATVAEIETILSEHMQGSGVPGYAMCIVQDGDVVYSRGFGLAELGGDLPVTSQSVFSVRSTTKSFTGVALMQLVEQGKIDLDAPVTTYLPYFEMADPRYKDITVRMLASHTSGLVDDEIFQNMPPRSEEPAETGAAVEWFVRSLAGDQLATAPGEIWQYAGTNFNLLGDIIAKVSGEPYDVYITKHLLEPLGMMHSTLDPAAIPSGALVGEHSTNVAGAVEAMPLSNYVGFEAPEGGVYSTCEDMTRWMQVHLNRGELDGVRILQPESYDVLWNVEAPTGLDEFFGPWIGQYGLGWAVAEDGGHFLAGHPGGANGQNIGFQLAPDDNLGVTVLANWGTEPDAYPAWMSAADVIYELLDMRTSTSGVQSGFAEVNGTRLYYEMAGEGEPVVMIHGLGWDTRSWDHQFAELAKHYQVIRYDMRGFGQSDMPTDQPYAHADDLKALLDSLGIDAAHVFGHSFGGEIAINFALAYPEATRSLVLIEPDIQGAQGLPELTAEEEASFAAVFEALDKGDNAAAGLAIVDMHPLVAVSRAVPGVRDLILQVFTDYQWWQFLNEDPVVQPDPPSADRIGEITAPTLLVVGDSTTEFQKIEVDRLVEQMPDAEKVVFENSDHFSHLLYPEEFNALVLAFLAKVSEQ
jgi:CubicO group peptidase (beta-lactamase class C family)/pimeloyl-ACP methyl ester carboxylesterase